MNKKNILIAILCASILLLVPLSNVSGASVGGLNNKVEIVEEAKPEFPYHLFEELVVLINQLLVEGSHIPKVVDICNEALEIIDSILQNPVIQVICVFLSLYWFLFGIGCVWFMFCYLGARDAGYPEEAQKYLVLSNIFGTIGEIFFNISVLLECEWIDRLNQDINIFNNRVGFNPQITPESISKYDITSIQEFIQSYEMNGCPCMYE